VGLGPPDFQGDISWAAFAYGFGTIAVIWFFKRFARVVPAAIVAVALSIVIASATDAASHGVSVLGAVPAGLPTVGLPQGFDMADFWPLMAVAASCVVLIIAQSAANSRSFAIMHGDRTDVNRDIVGLSGANLAAGLTGTFVVNGSPTKTQILDSRKDAPS